jgi:hydroxymethylbilane synthase
VSPQRTYVLGTRGSALALAQTHLVLEALKARYPQIALKVEPIRTTGDHDQTTSLSQIGGQGIFVKEIERALLAGEIDLAVHSLKDVPSVLPDGLTLAAMLPREDPRDALISRAGRTLGELPEGATVGTGSMRRRAQLRAIRADLQLLDIRGNVDTRLLKVREGAYDAAVLAVAGLRRLGHEGAIHEILSPEVMLPAPGQGTIVIQVRADDAAAVQLVSTLDDPATRAASVAERAFLHVLGAGCRLPIGAYGTVEDSSLRLVGMIGAPDGRRLVRGELCGEIREAEMLGSNLAGRLLAQGGADLLGEEGP